MSGYAYHKQYNLNHREAILKSKRKYYDNNKIKHSRAILNRVYLKNYGITIDEKERLIKLQNNKCTLCGVEFTLVYGGKNHSTKACVDHCHKTGNIRGIICSRCNRLLGLGKDDPVILRRAATYLEVFNESIEKISVAAKAE